MPYSHSRWTVKPGLEDEFVQAWNELARWTFSATAPMQGMLLRDRSASNRFVSYGAWPDVETIERWRATPELQAQLRAIEDLLEEYELGTYDVVGERSARPDEDVERDD